MISARVLDEMHGNRYCVLQFTNVREGWPEYAAVFHDTSVAPLVSRGECSIIEHSLSASQAQTRALTLNKEKGAVRQ